MIDNFKPVSHRAGARRFSRITTNTTPNTSSTPKPDFKLPEEIAEEQWPEPKNEAPRKKGRFSWRTLTRFHRLTKKQWLIVGILLVMIGGGGVGAWYKFFKKETPKPAPVVLRTKKEPPKPTTEASRLTGVQVTPEQNLLPVTGAMIENSPDARPQSGLKDAGLVFEAVAEGGITRFLALYMDTQPDYIGPIRSARPYYLDWILPFEGSLAHVGGSPDALAQIKALGVRDLDQFANSGSYKRISKRYAPHNVYSGLPTLTDLERKKGFGTSTFTGFARKKEEPSATPNARSVDLNISSFLYNAHYDWDQTTNTYKRSQGGQPHNDEGSSSQLAPKVVIALVMPKGVAGDGIHTTYTTVGSGPMFVFQDGVITPGTWTKTDRKAQFTFVNASGATMTLNPGQTWISIVGTVGSVTSKP
ncbi:DUF3048 domain-containing protein [Candidatus Saccharibacteria bacterium]|nr:DUF3048 domain-containing protein [Candidatus Saccharibacteria bacterium]MBI3338315.1 DUF3048 domain-containing protein [Candidatus Saccharibacteria bacterium]